MNTGSAWEKRALSILLTVIMVFSMMPLSVFAADGAVAEVTIGSTTTPYSDLASAFSTAQYASGSATVKLLDDIDFFATGNFGTDGVQLSSGDVTLRESLFRTEMLVRQIFYNKKKLLRSV